MEQFKEIRKQILNGNLDVAEQTLRAMTPGPNHERRSKAHLLAVVEFQRGNFQQSLDLMQKAADEFGDNVNLRRDMTSCYYQLQDMEAFRSSLNELENVLVEFEPVLGDHSLIESELMAGKFLEEDARLAPAVQHYDRALGRAKDPIHRLRALIQKARWQALYEPLPELSNYYRELISVPRTNLSRDLTVELEHSLMLLELRLIGSDHAWKRITRLTDLDPVDRRLLVFDFVEGVLIQDLELNADCLSEVAKLENLDPFEQFLRMTVQGHVGANSLAHELTLLAPKLPWSSHLRLLCISANMEVLDTVRQELHRKIQLIVRGLDTRSQVLWTSRLKQALQTDEIRLDFSPRKRSLSVQGKTVDLSKKKIGLQLLERLVQKNTISVDEAIQLLWQTSFSPEHYHRLRMSVHRLNTLINSGSGLGKVVEVDSQFVRLRPEIRLRQAEDSYDVGLIGI